MNSHHLFAIRRMVTSVKLRIRCQCHNKKVSDTAAGHRLLLLLFVCHFKRVQFSIHLKYCMCKRAEQHTGHFGFFFKLQTKLFFFGHAACCNCNECIHNQHALSTSRRSRVVRESYQPIKMSEFSSVTKRIYRRGQNFVNRCSASPKRRVIFLQVVFSSLE